MPQGFDARPGYVPQKAVAIHHPNGNIKRISYANNTSVAQLGGLQ